MKIAVIKVSFLAPCSLLPSSMQFRLQLRLLLHLMRLHSKQP